MILSDFFFSVDKKLCINFSEHGDTRAPSQTCGSHDRTPPVGGQAFIIKSWLGLGLGKRLFSEALCTCLNGKGSP